MVCQGQYQAKVEHCNEFKCDKYWLNSEMNGMKKIFSKHFQSSKIGHLKIVDELIIDMLSLIPFTVYINHKIKIKWK